MSEKKIYIGDVESHQDVGCPECYRDTGGMYYNKTGKPHKWGAWKQFCEQCQNVELVYDLKGRAC